jgi:hypothetical protein
LADIVAKDFLGDERNFLGPLMRFACGDVRELIVSHKTNHGPAHRRYRALQQWRSLNIAFAGFSAPFDFRLLQQYRHFSDMADQADDVR